MDDRSSLRTYVRRHHDLCAALRAGTIFDPERDAFLAVLERPPATLAATPWLADVSWLGGRFDLLFTDGHGAWCAVEVKVAPEIRGSGQFRRNCKRTYTRRLEKLCEQVGHALAACRDRVVGVVRALGLWLEDGIWAVVADVTEG